MEVRGESKKAAPLSGIEPVLGEIRQRLQSHPKDWLQKLREDPSSFADLDQRQKVQ